jgi:hypothetical protein
MGKTIGKAPQTRLGGVGQPPYDGGHGMCVDTTSCLPVFVSRKMFYPDY